MSIFLAIRLPDTVAERLTRLSVKTGYPKSWYVRQAILRYLDELEAQAEQKVSETVPHRRGDDPGELTEMS